MIFQTKTMIVKYAIIGVVLFGAGIFLFPETMTQMPEPTTFFQAITTDLSNLKSLNSNTEVAGDYAEDIAIQVEEKTTDVLNEEPKADLDLAKKFLDFFS